MANRFFPCTEVHTLIHYHFWQRKEREKTEVPLSLTLNPLTWKIWWAPNNASKWQMGFNSVFKGLNIMPRKWTEKGKTKSSPVLTTAVCEVNQSLEDYDVTPQACLLSALIWFYVRQSYQGGMGEACSTHNTYTQHNGRMTCREKPLRIPTYRWKGIKMNVK
jgi:hypothetical protein